MSTSYIKYVSKFQNFKIVMLMKNTFWPFENFHMNAVHECFVHGSALLVQLLFEIFTYLFSCHVYFLAAMAQLNKFSIKLHFELAYFSESYASYFIGFLCKYFIKFIEFMASLHFRFSSSAVNLIWN